MRRQEFSLVSVFSIFLLLVTAAFATPVRLRCEYRENPLGIDQIAPHLSWQSNNSERNWKQSGYEILVATTPQLLNSGKADVWDSGKKTSDESVDVAYAGPTLASRRRYFWKVRVWDSAGHVSDSAESAWWEMGLLHPEDWQAKWITRTNPEAAADVAPIRWIWVEGQDAVAVAPKAVATFQTTIPLKEKPQNAALFVATRGDFVASVNGHAVDVKSRWGAFDRQDISDQLVVGDNAIEIKVTAPDISRWGPDAGATTTKAALAALVKITQSNGTVARFTGDSTPGQQWQARVEGQSDWHPAHVAMELTDSRLGNPGPLPQAASYLRRTFPLPKTARSARLYVTALGSYRVYLNGSRVSTDVMTPDFTDYRKRVLYQTYDVSKLLTNGKNSISAILGDGWYGSPLTWAGIHFFPAPDRFLAQLEVEYSDGSHEVVSTNDSWKADVSPITESTIYGGEVYDARLDQSGWEKPDFDDSHWSPAAIADAPSIALSSGNDAPAQIIADSRPKRVSTLANGTYIFDMGQNMVGWATLKVKGAAGTKVRLRFAEILNPDGSIYTANLRNATATDTYTLRGGGEETFSPHFTFHGFRYVEVTGYPGTPTLDSITGNVVSSIAGDPVAKLATSSELVNHMWSIGIWGQRGNFLSIPTDCPQRDERLGWMGDAGVFWRTGTYNFDIAAFSQKFMQDIVDAQTDRGAFTNVSPNTIDGEESEDSARSVGAPGWGDAGVIIPWTSWMQYGDKALIEQHWDSMQRWMEFIQSRNPDFLRKNGVGPNFADWLAPDENTNKDLLATAYWALIAQMMEQMAHATGKDADAKKYDGVVQNIRAAFQKAYITDDGQVGTGTQTSYVVALYTKLAPEALEPKLVERLAKDIESRNWHLSTGFLGTPFLLFTLADHGRSDVAYRLLLNDTYPSWGYMLSKGATTWWERWNGDTGDPSMNSYNHYAFGSVVAWVYRYAAGIDTTVEAPGFKGIVIHPHLDSRMTSARADYESVYGKIVSDWNRTSDGGFSLRITIPPNTSAKVYLPVIAGKHVVEDGKAATAQREGDSDVVQVGSGSYGFDVK